MVFKILFGLIPVACSKRHLIATIRTNGMYFSSVVNNQDISGFWLTVWFHTLETWPVMPVSSSDESRSCTTGTLLLACRSISGSAPEIGVVEFDSTSRGD